MPQTMLNTMYAKGVGKAVVVAEQQRYVRSFHSGGLSLATKLYIGRKSVRPSHTFYHQIMTQAEWLGYERTDEGIHNILGKTNLIYADKLQELEDWLTAQKDGDDLSYRVRELKLTYMMNS